jgi:hypothetical protein
MVFRVDVLVEVALAAFGAGALPRVALGIRCLPGLPKGAGV